MSATLQLGFDGLLREAETGNRRRRLDRQTAHLPGDIEAAIRHHRTQIAEFHAAMQVPDLDAAARVIEQARLMALRCNRGDPGILAGPTSPGNVLARRCASKGGVVPLWGQQGTFRITIAGTRIQIVMEGMFGLGWPLPGFAAHAVDADQPFISETGYRSFLGCWIKVEPNMTTASYAEATIAHHVAHELKGKLRRIDPKFRR